MNSDAALSQLFCEQHPADAAAVLMRLPAAGVAAFLMNLPAPGAAALLQNMLPERAARIIPLLEPQHAAAIFSQLKLTETAGLLRPLATAQRDALFAALPAKLTAQLSRVIRFPAGTVGSLLSTPLLSLRDDWTVRYGLREFKQLPANTLTDLPVVDQDQYFLGTVSLHGLLTGHDELRVSALINESTPALPAEAPLASIVHHPMWDRSTAAPVVDLHNKLLGVLQRATLRQHLTNPSHAPRSDLLAPVLALAEVYWSASSSLVAVLGERFNQPRK